MRERPVVIVLALVILLMPFPKELVRFTHGNAGYDYQAILFPSDLPLAALIVLMIPHAVRSMRDGSFGLLPWLALALSAWLAVAYLFHPSGRGVVDVFRLLGVVAIIAAILDLREGLERSVVLVAVAAAAALQTVIGLLQIAVHGPIGLRALGESRTPLWPFGSAWAPQATMVHPYVLAGLALVAGVILAIVLTRAWKWPVALATAAAIAPVGFTYGRAALLGVILAIGSLATGLFSDRRRYLPAVLALCLGVAVPAVLGINGWTARGQQTTRAGDESSLTTDRGWLIHEADGLIVDQPVVGVGPGRYVIALTQKFGYERNRRVSFFKPVHDLPLLAAAEGGVLAGLLMTALLLAAGWRALVAGRAGLALYLAYLPLVLLDHFPYSFPMGLIITGLWLGAIEFLARERSADGAVNPLPEAHASDRESRPEDAPRTQSAGQ
ncbi:MAG: O-antigen ligase family protein [Acidimicrobiia bacterium]|nr:O-antigen ligase family protein [Acidimicrobiia bacterium]